MAPRTAILGLGVALALLASRASAEDGAAPGAAPDWAAQVAALASEDAAARDAAEEAIVTAAGAAVPALVDAAKSPERPSRRSAVRILGLLGGAALPALPALNGVLAEPKAPAPLVAEAAAAVGSIAVGAAKAAETKGAGPSFVELAIAAGAEWLARHQHPDGHWSSGAFNERCTPIGVCQGGGEGTYDPGVTGLAVNALLDAGETPVKGPHAAAVASALKWLVGRQDRDGCIGPRTSQHFLYNHAIGSLALASAYRRARIASLREPVTNAVAFIHAARNKDLAWRYAVPADGDNDTSITVWMAKALGEAQAAGIEIDHEARNGALAWVDRVTDEKTGRTGYQQKGGPPARTNDVLATYPGDKSEAMTAAAMGVRLAVGRTRASDPYIAMGEALLAAKPPVWSVQSGTIDLYYWFHGAEVLHALGGPVWLAWRKSLIDALVPSQRPKQAGCAKGSWDATDPWGAEGGRVYTTSAALSCLSHAADDPARRPAMPQTVRPSTWALDKLVTSKDPTVQWTAQHALERIRNAYR